MTNRTFYLIRHGVTDWNIQQRWQGQSDIPLNDVGREQARRLGEYLRDVPFDRVISSDSIRAFETMQLALGGRNLPIEVDTVWREINMGVLEGLTWNEIQVKHADIVIALDEDWYGVVIPKGESRGAMQQRVLTAFKQVVDDGAGQHVMIVTHGTMIRGLLHGLFPDEIEHAKDVTVENTSVTIIRQTADGLMLAQRPLAMHLQAAAD